ASLVTLFILPFILVIGGAIAWYAPIITRAEQAHFQLIRIVGGLLMLSLIINKVFDIFEAVLRGMNLGYKRMGFRAGIVAIGGASKVLVIQQGYGLIGLAVVDVALALITALTFYYIVRAHVSWFGFGRTTKKKTVEYGKLSGW